MKKIKKQAREIIKAWEKESKKIMLTDDYLRQITALPREEGGMIAEYQHGICYLRDDAVNALLQYIKLLENIRERVGNTSLMSKLEKEAEEDIKTAQEREELEDLFDL